MKNEKQMSESFYVGLFLTCVGGFLDAYTYICRDGVFANAQTGNMVLMSIKLAEGNIMGGLYYMIPIFAFVSGILITGVVRRRFRQMEKIHWRQIIIGFEILVLFGISFIPQGKYNVVANVLVSFVCSLQVQSFRKIAGKAYASTMCTGNLRSGSEHLSHYIGTGDKEQLLHALKYYLIIVVFLIGAGIGALITDKLGIQAILVACGGLLIPFFLMFKK
ncbi:MAG: YoaK family protein [Hespellia sp.]|nr:YoaK family protein [Hespellia sp.]